MTTIPARLIGPSGKSAPKLLYWSEKIDRGEETAEQIDEAAKNYITMAASKDAEEVLKLPPTSVTLFFNRQYLKVTVGNKRRALNKKEKETIARRFLEFFAATIRNKNTRMAYYRAACSFFAWVERHHIGELADIEPIHVAAYIEGLQATAAKPTVKQHLAAVRMLFDWLVVGQVLAVNPAHAVRGPKHVVRRGKTPVLTEDQARRLLESIDTSTLVGLRDRALIGAMTYTFARIGAVVAMKVEDYYPAGKRWWLRLHEKGGKRHDMPVHHKLEQFLDEYLDAAGIREAGKTPLFRSAAGKTGRLTENPMHRVDAYQMIRRRTAEAGFKVKLGCHVFRATGITAYLEAGGSLENAQAMAAHESPRTTKLYDRTGDEITLDEVERITI